MNAPGPSASMSGLADVAALEGRFTDAARFYTEGAAHDLAAQNLNRAAAKYAALANAHLGRQRNQMAIAAAEKALMNSQGGRSDFWPPEYL